MNQNNDFPNPQCLEFLELVPAYLCFARIWWDGDGIDTAIWWEDAIGFHHRLLMTGETWTPKEPVLIKEKRIRERTFGTLCAKFEQAGILTPAPQSVSHITTHYDDWYGIRYEGLPNGRWLQIAGGEHAEQPLGGDLLDVVYAACPELRPFSAKRKNL